MAVLRAMSAGLLAATALLAGACGGDASGEGGNVAPVDTMHVRAMDVPATIAAVGTVEADHQTTVQAEVSGRVVAVLRDEGSPVAAGTPVIQLDPGSYRDAVAAAAADLSRARATLAADERLLARYEKLLEVGAIDPQTYENLEARVASERAAVQQAAAGLATARRELAWTTVRAPFTGTVGKRHVQLGEYVSGGGGGGNGGGGLFDLVDAQPVKIRFTVTELHADEVAVGNSVRFRVRSDTVATRIAQVDYVSPRIDPSTRTFEVTATYTNPDLAVRPGAYAEVVLTTRVHEGAAVVPEAALVTEGTDNFVFVVRDSAAERRKVVVGARVDGLVEIVEGLRPGEVAIVAGQHGLPDGAPVRPTPREARSIEPRG